MEHYQRRRRPLEIINTILLILAVSFAIAAFGVSCEIKKLAGDISGDTSDIVSGKFTGYVGEKVGEDMRLKKQYPEYTK